ncbi:MAG: hypothetical protein ACRC42_02315 [Mycoplasma sp.]
MCKILLSIKPEYVEKIFIKEKIFEFRKTETRRKIDKIFIYSTHPIMKIVGEAEVSDTLVDSPKNLWKITNKFGGVSKNLFDQYYLNKNIAVAYKLINVIKYDKPLELSAFKIKHAPQSFIYID